jgi:hypothetical protein
MQQIGVHNAVAIGTGGKATVVLLASPIEELVGPQNTFFFVGRRRFLFSSLALFDQLFELLVGYGVHGAIAFLARSTDYPLT